MRWDGRRVMITGAGGGIGRSLALAYAELGAEVAAVDKRAEQVRQTADLIQGPGGECSFFAVDLSKPDEITGLFNELGERWGSLDVLINNAGMGISKSPLELTLDDWDEVLNTNLRGTFLCSRGAAPLMDKGSIINISSTRALMSEPNSEAYAASKGGILSLTHALAASLGPLGIRVNAISPGWIETGDYGALRPQDHAQHPAGRVGNTGDIVKACLYLSDPANDYVTGTHLVIDGGMTRKMIYEE